MIFAAIPPNGSEPSVVLNQVLAENAATPRTFSFTTTGPEPENLNCFAGDDTPQAVPMQSIESPVIEEFDWNNKKVRQEFIRLEQKVLVAKAAAEEVRRYEAMKSYRNSEIFADRTFRDYAEIQRLRKLSERLEEIQKYLRPIPLR